MHRPRSRTLVVEQPQALQVRHRGQALVVVNAAGRKAEQAQPNDGRNQQPRCLGIPMRETGVMRMRRWGCVRLMRPGQKLGLICLACVKTSRATVSGESGLID